MGAVFRSRYVVPSATPCNATQICVMLERQLSTLHSSTDWNTPIDAQVESHEQSGRENQ